MCGRYDLSQNPAAIKAHFRVPSVPDFLASPDVRPTEREADRAARAQTGERECVLARWGLVPTWAKDLKFGNRCINARAETIATTPSFRSAYAKRHCLVPLNAFYEWTGEKGHKIQVAHPPEGRATVRAGRTVGVVARSGHGAGRRDLHDHHDRGQRGDRATA